MGVWVPQQHPLALALREPALLVPGRKPVGPVRLRLDHPLLAPGSFVKAVLLAEPAGFRDLLTGQLMTMTSGASAYDGQGIYNTTAGTAAKFPLPVSFDPDDGTNGNALWMVAAGQFLQLGAFNTLLAITNNNADRDAGIECGSTTSVRVGFLGDQSSFTVTDYTGAFFSASLYTPESDVLGGAARNSINIVGQGRFRATPTGAVTFFPPATNSFNLGEDSTNNRLSLYLLIVGAGPISADLQESVTNDPYQILQPAANDQIFIGAAGAGGDLSVTVPGADLTLSAFAPDVTRTTTADITVPAADLTLSATAPTVTAGDNRDITVAAADLVLTATAPTAARTDNHAITVAVADLTLSTFAPDVQAGGNVSLTVPVADLALSTTAPAVARTDNRDITVAVADLALSTTAPSVAVLAPGEIAVPAAELTFTTTAPTVLSVAPLAVTVPAADITFTTTAPQRVVNLGVSPGAASLLLSTLAPTLAKTDNHAITVSAAALAISTTAPTRVGGTMQRVVPALNLTLSTEAPTVATSIWVPIGAASGTWTPVSAAAGIWSEM